MIMLIFLFTTTLQAADDITELLHASTKRFIHYAEQHPKGHPPLIRAIRNNNPDFIERCINHRDKQTVNVNVIDPWDNRTPLHVACLDGNISIAKLLIKHGANLNAQTHTGDTPLHWAAEYGNPKTVTLLLNHGAERSITNSNGQTALMLAQKRIFDHKDASYNAIIDALLSPDKIKE